MIRRLDRWLTKRGKKWIFFFCCWLAYCEAWRGFAVIALGLVVVCLMEVKAEIIADRLTERPRRH